MATTQENRNSRIVRALTDEEVAHYHRYGWAKLEKLVDTQVVAEMLEYLRARMGEDASVEVDGGYTGDAKTSRPPQARALFNSYEGLSREEPVFERVALSAEMGQAMSRLCGGQARYWDDMALVKMPVGKEGGKTPWHQDSPYYPMDRIGMLNVWVALVDVPPNMGSMRFISGSHRWGPLGRVIGRTDGVDTLDLVPPDLRDQIET